MVEILLTSYCIIESDKRRLRRLFPREINWRGSLTITRGLSVIVKGLISTRDLSLELISEEEVETMMIRMTRVVEVVVITLVRLVEEGSSASALMMLVINCCL